MAIRLEKPWITLDSESVAALPGQLGVYELADENHEVVYLGFAGGRSSFGLRSELSGRLGAAAFFRYEVTTAYRTRIRELLMVYHADHGSYPAMNSEAEVQGLGRLSPIIKQS